MSENCRFTVKLTPKASRNAIQGWADGPSGKVLKVSVTAVPEKGKANKELIKLLADFTGIPKTAFAIIRGKTDRLKLIEIKGFSEDIFAKFNNMEN